MVGESSSSSLARTTGLVQGSVKKLTLRMSFFCSGFTVQDEVGRLTSVLAKNLESAALKCAAQKDDAER